MLHGAEGALFIGGIAFLSAEMVLPAMIRSLGGSTWLISIMPMMMMLGFMGPPLLTAHWVEMLPKVKPFVLITGFFQRIPYLITGLVMVFWESPIPWVLLLLAVTTPFISGMMGGVSMTAWMELVAKSIPAEKRASLHAMRNIIGTLMGLGVGPVVLWVLSAFPGPLGYGMLHLSTFCSLLGSYILFFLIVEPADVLDARPKPRKSLLGNVRSMPGLVLGNPQLKNFTMMAVCSTGIFILTPYMSLHALEVTGRPESFLGAFVTAQMSGSLLGNVIAGYLGDRFGGRVLLIISRVFFLILCIGILFIESELGFFALFFLYGFGFFTNMIGRMILTLEICEPSRRPTFVAFLSAVNFIVLLGVSVLSTTLKTYLPGIEPVAISAAILLGCSLIYIRKISEPRGTMPPF